MDDQKLWHLLGRAPLSSAPPFFAAKVIRQIEARDEHRSWLAPVLRLLAPAAVAALVIVAIFPRPAVEPIAVAELTTLDLMEMLSPDDHETLTVAGWPYNNGFLSAGL
jgi:hypothetical protein